MRAPADLDRSLIAVLLCTAFLAASLAPCPPRDRAEPAVHAEPMGHAADCEMHAKAATLTAPCPCGCGAHAPLAGSSARLGVALPSTCPAEPPPALAAHAPATAPLFEGSFVPPIDHVPRTA